MVTLKELENKRIKKIKSLDENQLNNYVDVLSDEMRDILDFDNVTDIDESLAEFNDLVEKFNEIYDVTGYNFKAKADDVYKAAINIELIKYIIKEFESKNLLLNSVFSNLLMDFANLENYIVLLYQLLMDFKDLSGVSGVENMKLHFIDPLKKMIVTTKELLDLHYRILNKSFYSDERIINDIHEYKVTIKNYADSDDEMDKLLVKYGLIDCYVDFIKATENHAEIKELYMQQKPDIDELIASADNVFKKYSAEKYDAASGISFDEFMKLEPKFNIVSGELIE